MSLQFATRSHRDRDPLTQRCAREVRHTAMDSYDYWEGPVPVQKPRKYHPPIPTQAPLWVRFARAAISLWRST